MNFSGIGWTTGRTLGQNLSSIEGEPEEEDEEDEDKVNQIMKTE